MKQILTDYIEICLKFRKEYISKPERKQRHILLTEWAKAQYADGNPTIPELYEFWDKYKDVSYNKIFIEKAIVPTVNEDFQNGGIEGLKFLFYCLHGRDGIEYISRSEEHTSELQSRPHISYAVFCLKKNFFNDTATTEIYTLSLHDALPI